MPKVSIQSNELVGTDVDFVALVKRGANRIPFRITKEDNEQMLDLSSLSSAFFKKAEKRPGVFAIMINKDAGDLDGIKKTLTDAGFSVENGTETDTAFIFKQEGVDEFDTGNIMISADVGFVVSGLAKQFSSYDFEATTFGEAHKVNAFYPSVRNAVDTMNEMLYGIMQKADSPADAAASLAKAASEFTQYVEALARGLPERAFKAEVALVKAEIELAKVAQTEGKGFAAPASSPQNKPKTKTREEEENTASDASGLPAKAKKGEADPVAVAKAALEKAELEAAAKTDPVAAAKLALAKAEEEAAAKEAAKKAEAAASGFDMDALMKSMGELFDKKLADTTKAIKTEIDGIQKTVTEVSDRTKKAEEALNGTVVSEPNGERRDVRKQEHVSKGVPPLLDTAYTSNASV